MNMQLMKALLMATAPAREKNLETIAPGMKEKLYSWALKMGKTDKDLEKDQNQGKQ